MSKNTAKFNYWVDVVFMITLTVVILTGFVIWGWKRPEGMHPGMTSAHGAPEIAQRAPDRGEQTPPRELSAESEPQTSPGEAGEAAPTDARPDGVPNVSERKDEAPRESPVVSGHGADARQGGGRPMMGESKILWGLFKGRTFLGMTKRGWNNVHAWVSMVMLLCFILHLKTHFRWLVVMSKKGEKEGEGQR